jgi:hypothetical protein
MPDAPNQVQLQIVLPDEVAQGVYTNLAMVSHSDAEFTLDFIYLQPQQPKATVRARVVTSPQHAKRLLTVLQEHVAHYEAQHGPLSIPAPPVGMPRH